MSTPKWGPMVRVKVQIDERYPDRTFSRLDPSEVDPCASAIADVPEEIVRQWEAVCVLYEGMQQELKRLTDAAKAKR